MRGRFYDSEREQATIDMLKDPNTWPRWPVLPMKRLDDTEAVGVVVAVSGYEYTLFKTNMYLVPNTVEELLKLDKEQFKSAEDVLAAGWVVD